MSRHQGVLTNTQILKLAWRITGGWSKAFTSTEFVIALVVWVLCAPYWLYLPWWDQVISVLPNVLGFTLGGFAIFLGFGSDSFKKMLAHEDQTKSLYLSVSAAFLVFVWLQILALLYAFVAKALHFDLPVCLSHWKHVLQIGDAVSSGVGYFLFIYSLILALRAAIRIFRLSRWYNDLMVAEQEQEIETTKEPDK